MDSIIPPAPINIGDGFCHTDEGGIPESFIFRSGAIISGVCSTSEVSEMPHSRHDRADYCKAVCYYIQIFYAQKLFYFRNL